MNGKDKTGHAVQNVMRCQIILPLVEFYELISSLVYTNENGCHVPTKVSLR